MEGEVKSVGGIEIEISYWIFSVNPPPTVEAQNLTPSPHA